MRRTLAQKCKKKRENVEENRPVQIPVLGEDAQKDLVQCSLAIHKQGPPVVWDMIIQKYQEIHH